MRIALPILILLIPGWAHAGEKELLDKFQRLNDAGHAKLEAQIKQAMEKADVLEKADPAQALGLLQDVRDQMLRKGLLATKKDRDLAEPLWERIKGLRTQLRAKRADELRFALGQFRDYMFRTNDELSNLRRDMVPAGKTPPPGGPVFIAFGNGKTGVGWLNEPPMFVVNVTIDSEVQLLPPGAVAGLQGLDGFYVFHPVNKRFERLNPAEFFGMAITAHPPAEKRGFWLPASTPPPPPGLFARSPGVAGAALFAYSAGVLMTDWAGPGGTFPARGSAATEGNATTARLLLEANIELEIHETFITLHRADRARLRDVIMTFLDRRPTYHPLTAEEIVRLGELIAEAYPDRRGDASTFALRLNRILDPGKSGSK
jgi:hypothetical protein